MDQFISDGKMFKQCFPWIRKKKFKMVSTQTSPEQSDMATQTDIDVPIEQSMSLTSMFDHDSSMFIYYTQQNTPTMRSFFISIS